MRLLFGCLVVSLVLVGCGSKQGKVSTDNSATMPETKVMETPKLEAVSPTQELSPATKSGTPPVEFTSLGLSTDKKAASYKIKVNTAEPISQVD